MKLKPDYALALYNLALAHLHKGQIARARRYVSRALVLDPKNEQILNLSRQLEVKVFWRLVHRRLNPHSRPSSKA